MECCVSPPRRPRPPSPLRRTVPRAASRRRAFPGQQRRLRDFRRGGQLHGGRDLPRQRRPGGQRRLQRLLASATIVHGRRGSADHQLHLDRAGRRQGRRRDLCARCDRDLGARRDVQRRRRQQRGLRDLRRRRQLHRRRNLPGQRQPERRRQLWRGHPTPAVVQCRQGRPDDLLRRAGQCRDHDFTADPERHGRFHPRCRFHQHDDEYLHSFGRHPHLGGARDLLDRRQPGRRRELRSGHRRQPDHYRRGRARRRPADRRRCSLQQHGSGHRSQRQHHRAGA